MAQPYRFNWNDLGDLTEGRPHLGNSTSVQSYRLMQFTFKQVLCERFGREQTAELFRAAGLLAGREFCRNLLDTGLPPMDFIAALQQRLIDEGIGILRFEQTDLERLHFVLTVDEDLDCSGLPLMGETVCDYDEGFIAGVFEQYLGRPFEAVEIDCWATGGRTCRFEVRAVPL